MLMDTNNNIFIVDDDDTTRLLLETMLGSKYEVETFGSAEACLDRLEKVTPRLLLLDVGLPEMDGYDLCRVIKKRSEMQHVPVVFVSGRDDPNDILAGYGAGGEDYIVKPFDIVVLHHKIENLRRIEQAKEELQEQAKSSDEITALVMANLDEYAVLIKFLRSLNDCDTAHSLLDSLFSLLRGYHLDGAAQVRLPDLELTVNESGESSPLEVAVINHVRSMDRILEFKMRCAFNYQYLTILINNMPLHDPDLCGRIRDNVIIAVECANAKLQAQLAKAENTHSRTTAASLLDTLQTVVMDFDREYRQARYRGSSLTQGLLDELATAFASLGLSDEQEVRIDGIIRIKLELMADAYDFSDRTRAALNDIASRLTGLLRPSAAVSISDESSATAGAALRSVELF